MKTIHGILVMVLFLLITNSLMARVNAQPYFSVYPTEGTINTDIFLQVRGLPGSGFYETYYLYIFWDDTLLGVFPDNSQTYDHYFDTHFSPPNSTIEALGNHTVYFEVWNNGRIAMYINATFIFTITEYFPGPEYLALNATYTTLLTNYKALNASYYVLQAQYNELFGNYSSLLSEYNSLLVQYENLLTNYNSLSANYNDLSESYDSLTAYFNSLNSTYYSLLYTHNQLQSNYNSLQNSYDNQQGSYDNLSNDYNYLVSNYVQLQGNYTSLNSSYGDLQTEYSNLLSELTNYRNLSYALVVTTLVFIATTVYFARRKAKLKT